MLLIPLAGAIFYGLALGHYKWFLGKTKLSPKTVLPVYLGLIFGMSLLLLPRFGTFDRAFFVPRYFVLFVFLGLLGIASNYFLIRGLRRTSLHEFELIDLLVPVFTVSLAALAFPDERNPLQLGLALLAGCAFLLTHLKNHHFNFKQTDRWLLFTVFTMAMERIVVKPLLWLASPMTLYSLRTGFVALVTWFIFRPKVREIRDWEWGQLGMNAGLSVIAMSLIWSSIGNYGIVVTEIYLLLAPIVLALMSFAYFEERWTFRQSMAFVVILLCVFLVNLVV